MSNKNSYFKTKLHEIEKQKGEITKAKPDEVIQQIIHQDPEKAPDMEKIAAELKSRHEKESKSKNQGFIKDTIYIREDLYKAMAALSLERGDKKKHVNEAYEMYILAKYEEMPKNK